MYVPFVFLGPFLSSAQVGLSERDSAWLVSSLGLFNIAGRVVLGVAADRIGRLRTVRLSLAIMLATTVAYPLCGSWLSSLLLVVVPYGTFSGSFIAMPPALNAMHVVPRLPEALIRSLGPAAGRGWVTGRHPAWLQLAGDVDRQHLRPAFGRAVC
jgi:predicted MFS family arabinose efflux permease